MIKVHEQNAIQELAAKGWSQRRVASSVLTSRKRVVRLIREAAPQRVWRIETDPGEEVQVDLTWAQRG